jgi:hypothetical protein
MRWKKTKLTERVTTKQTKQPQERFLHNNEGKASMESNLKTIVRGAYDVQKLRIQMGNRIVGNFKAKLGQLPSTGEDEMDAEGKQILANLRASFKKITDGVKTFPRQATFVGDEVISSYTELCLLAQYIELEKAEDQHFGRLGNILKDYPIYNEFLEPIRGVGPAMAGVIISEIDIHKARYPSSLWAYAGLDVAANGAGRSRKKEHLVEIAYTDKDGKPATRVGITFNPFLKTKLVGVLASSFLKQPADKCVYRLIYDQYKHRLESSPKYGTETETSRGHRHNMAMRYTIKRFLVDLYAAWRKIEGLPVSPEYHEAKLGHKHRAA